MLYVLSIFYTCAFKLHLFYIKMSVDNNPKEEELCLVDSCTTNSILREIKYFQSLEKREGNIMTIASQDALIVGSGRATITLPMGT